MPYLRLANCRDLLRILSEDHVMAGRETPMEEEECTVVGTHENF